MNQTVITSRSNALVKKLNKLKERKYREKFGEYVAEGKRWVSDAMKICPKNVISVICSQDKPCDFADTVMSADIFEEIADTENNQGLMALMKIPPQNSAYSCNYCLYLDRVRDPGNMGTIIRTACAAGYGDIVLRDCVDVYNGKVIRSCMTGVLGVNFHYGDSLSHIKESGYKTVAATLGGDNIFDCDIKAEKLCLVIGNEADGIAENLIDECDFKVTIPMNESMESLNAAVSAGILMYQLKFSKR